MFYLILSVSLRLLPDVTKLNKINIFLEYQCHCAGDWTQEFDSTGQSRVSGGTIAICGHSSGSLLCH